MPPGLLRQVGEQLVPGEALGHMPQLLDQKTILFGDCKEQVLDQPRVELTGGGADGQNTPHIKGQGHAVLYRNHVIEQRAAVRSHIGLAKHLTHLHRADDAAVSPVVIPLDVECALCQEGDVTHRFTGPEHVLSLFIVLHPGLKAAQHRQDLFLLNAGK